MPRHHERLVIEQRCIYRIRSGWGCKRVGPYLATRNAGQCSGLQAGGEGPRWAGRQGPSSALIRAVLLFDVLLHDRERRAADGAREVGTGPELVGPVVVRHEVGELLAHPP